MITLEALSELSNALVDDIPHPTVKLQNAIFVNLPMSSEADRPDVSLDSFSSKTSSNTWAGKGLQFQSFGLDLRNGEEQ